VRLDDVFDIFHKNHGVHVVKDAFDVVGVRGGGKVEEALSLHFVAVGGAVLRGSASPVVATFLGDVQKFVPDETARTSIFIGWVCLLGGHLVVFVIGKVVLNFGTAFNFLLENILLVEKENETSV